MPSQLFDPSSSPRIATHNRWTVVLSTLAHLVVVCILIVVPLMATDVLPAVRAELTTFIPATVEVPTPPPPPPGASRPAAAPMAAPTSAPEGIMDPRDIPDVAPAGAPEDSGGFENIGTPGGVIGAFGPVGGQGLIEPPPAPEPQKPLHVGGEIRAPQRITYMPPVYPPIAQAARVEGTVILEAIIDASGLVRDVRVLRSVALLDQAAIDAVRQWKYTPTRLNGMPVPVIMTVTVSFKLQ